MAPASSRSPRLRLTGIRPVALICAHVSRNDWLPAIVREHRVVESIGRTFHKVAESQPDRETGNPKSGGAASGSALEPLREILDKQDFDLTEKIAVAIGAPQSCLGLLAAISHAAQCLSKLCARENYSKLRECSIAVTRIATQLALHSALPPHFTAVPDLKSLSSTFRLFVERGSLHSREINDEIGEIKALAFTDAVARRKVISDSFASRLLTLQRSASKSSEGSKFWQQLADDLPFNEDDARALIEQTSFDPVREFLRELVPLLDGRIPDLEHGQNIHSIPEKTAASAIDIEGASPEQSNGNDAEEEAVANDGYAITEGLVAWQNKRSTNAGRLTACGLPFGWDHLHPEELRRATTQLAAILSNPSSDKHAFACLALISLASSLPPKLALLIPLLSNEDIWLDVDAGLLNWNLNRVVQRNSPDPVLLENSYRPSSIIRLPLPASVASTLRILKPSHNEACTMGELLFGSIPDRAELLRRYEQFIKLGDSSSHCPRPSRFAYSLGRSILETTGQDVVAALTSLDFALAAPGQLHYVCLNESVLFDAIDKTYAFLGLGETTRPQHGGYVGSPLRPRDDVIVEAWRKQREESERLKRLITPRMSIRDFISIYNQLCFFHLGAIAFLSGHRGTRLERLKFPMLFSSREFLGISDKESTEYSVNRILPRFQSLDAVLEAHLSLLRSLTTRIDRHDRKLAKRLADISLGKRKNCPLFFIIREKGKTWELMPVRTAHLADYFLSNFGAARNFARHFWLSKLIEIGAPRMLPRFFLGHARRGMEPHGAAGGVSVRTACKAIGPMLSLTADSFGFKDLALVRTSSYQSDRLPFRFPRTLAKLESDFITDYIASLDSPGHTPSVIAEPCPYDRMTLAGHSAISFLRERFTIQTASLEPWPRLLVALIIFDGVSDSRLIEAAWNSIQERLVRVGQTPIIELSLPSGMRPLLLQTPTAVCLNKAITQPPISFATACRTVSDWAEEIAGFPFSAPTNAIAFLCSLMVRWMRIEIAPWLMTSCSPDFSAACISMRSLARTAYGKPALPSADQPEPPVSGRSTRTSLETEISDLAKIVNDIADTKKKHGENRKRLRLLHEALVAHLREASLSPLALDIAVWLVHEVTVEHPLEVASIASYLSKLKGGFIQLDQETSFEDLDPDDWLEFKEVIETGHAGEQLKQRQSILRRFSTYWRNRGCAVPGAIFAAADGAAAEIMHASTIYASRRDVERVATLIGEHFSSQPLLRKKSEIKLSLCSHAPFRSGEISRVRSVDVGAAIPAVFITSSGFSHLKNQRHSRGSVQLDDLQYQNLLSLGKTADQLSTQRSGYIWLLDDPDKRFSDVAELDHALGRALRLATGEMKARIHSLRGSAVARNVTPLADDVLVSLSEGAFLWLPAPSVDDHEWLKISIAARQARHSRPLTTLRYYCATWPIELFFELSQTLESVPVDDGYATYVDGLRPDALRQAKSRARRDNPTSPLAEWQMLAKRLSEVSKLASVETLLAKNATNPSLMPHKSRTDTLLEKQCIHYVLLRTAGSATEVAINESRVSLLYVPILEELLRNDEPTMIAATGSDSAGPSACDQREWRRHLARESGQKLMSGAASCRDIAVVAKAIQLLDTEARFNIQENALLQTIRTLRDVVPEEFTFNILPSLVQSSPTLQRRVTAIDPQASVKRASKRHGVGYTLTLTSVEPDKRGPRPDGNATNVFRQALRAQLILISAKFKGEDVDVRTPNRP
jgi:hypothetical protein